MSKNTDFSVGTIVTDTFLDSIQELLTGAVQNVRLKETLASDRVSLAISGDFDYDKRGVVNIGGQYCYFDTSQDSSASTAGIETKSIFLSTTANGTTQAPEFEITVSATEPAASYIKRIGYVDYDSAGLGGNLSNARMITGVQADFEQYNSFVFRSVYNLAEETILNLQGQSLQTSPSTTSDPSLTPTKSLSIGYGANEYFYIDTLGRLVWENGGADAAISLLNADAIGSNTRFSIWKDGLGVTGSYTLPNTGAAGTRDDGLSAFGARQNIDSSDRFQISTTGVITWGGGGARDAGLYRVGASQLSTLPDTELYLDYDIATINAGGDRIAVTKEFVVSAVIGSASIDDLNDVTITGATEGQTLRYDTPANQWINTSAILVSDDDTTTFSGRTIHNGIVNESIVVVENGAIMMTSPGDIYDVDMPNDNTVLCTMLTGDVAVRLPSNHPQRGTAAPVDGDKLRIKDIDGGAGLNVLSVVGEGVTQRNIPLVSISPLTGAPVDQCAPITEGGVGVDEQQLIKVTGTGTFNLVVDGDLSGVLSVTATATDVQDAFNNMIHPKYGYISVSVSGIDIGTGVTVTFDGGTLIDGELDYVLPDPYQSVDLTYYNGNWYLI